MKKFARIATSVIAAFLFSSCAANAEVEPAFSGANFWFPGYVGVPGFAANGLGPAGYPGVQDDTIDSEPVQQFLASVLLQPDDLPPGMTLALLPKGNLISQPSFTLCGLEFETEQTRLVRRAVQAIDSEGDAIGVRSEAIQHESAEAASAALREFRNASKRCADSSFEFFNPAFNAKNLVSTQFLAVAQWTQSAPEAASWLQIWQQRGNTIVSVELTEPTNQPLSADLISYAIEVAERVADRLAAADPLDIGEFQ